MMRIRTSLLSEGNQLRDHLNDGIPQWQAIRNPVGSQGQSQLLPKLPPEEQLPHKKWTGGGGEVVRGRSCTIH